MVRIIILLSVAVVGMTPLSAQDTPGAVDLGALSRTQVQSATARGYAERGDAQTTGPNGVRISAKARAYCEDYPNVVSRLGKDDARVLRLAAACRRAGYPY